MKKKETRNKKEQKKKEQQEKKIEEKKENKPTVGGFGHKPPALKRILAAVYVQNRCHPPHTISS